MREGKIYEHRERESGDRVKKPWDTNKKKSR